MDTLVEELTAVVSALKAAVRETLDVLLDVGILSAGV